MKVRKYVPLPGHKFVDVGYRYDAEQRSCELSRVSAKAGLAFTSRNRGVLTAPAGA